MVCHSERSISHVILSPPEADEGYQSLMKFFVASLLRVDKKIIHTSGVYNKIGGLWSILTMMASNKVTFDLLLKT